MMVFGFSGLKLWLAIAVAAIFTLPGHSSSLANPVASQPETLVFSVFSLQQKSNGLFTIKADGRDRRRMTRVRDINSAVWSPDGKKLAFTANSDQDVYVTNADGSQLITVFQGDFCKASSMGLYWTADSQQLIFSQSCDPWASDTPGSQTFYFRNLARGAKTKLVGEWQMGGFPPVNDLDVGFSLSPDSRQISFVKNQNLYRMNNDGSKLTQLTNENQRPKPDSTQIYWSPDSRKIARLDFFSGDVPRQKISIFDRDGRLLKQWRIPQPGKNGSDSNLIWSPDSQRLVYFYTKNSQRDIYLYDLAETAPRNLTRQPGEYSGINWSPDGKQIAFQSKTKQGSMLYTIAVDQTEWTPPRTLTSKPGEYSQMVWSPDGKQIALLLKTERGNTLYAITLDQTKWIPLIAEMARDEIQELTWSPNSQQLAFTVMFNVDYSNLYVVNRDGSGLKPLTFGRNNVSNPAWRP